MSADSEEDFELVRGSGNVFRDFGRPNADIEQARVIIAVQIKHVLDARKLTNLDAAALTGVTHTEYSRIRNAKLGRFTLDRLMTILGKLDQDVEISVDVHPRRVAHAAPPVA